MAAPAAPTMTMLGEVMWRTIDGQLYAVFPTAISTNRRLLNQLAINVRPKILLATFIVITY